MSVVEVVGHTAEGCLWYAIDLAAGGADLGPVEHRVRTEGDAGEVVETLRTYAHIVASVVEASPSTARGFHPMGTADPSGFAAMACDEMLIHTDDAARGLRVSFEAPSDLVEPVLRRLFPWITDTADPWSQLRWANGRVALPDRPRLTDWAWHCAPLSEWDGSVSTAPTTGRGLMSIPAPIPTLETERLRLRRWTPEDREPFAAMNADPEVMEFFHAALTRAESDAFVDRIEHHFEDNGFGLWAVDILEGTAGRFAGFVGLWPATFAAHFTPTVEVGWRLDRWAWGRGYATEAAERAVADGFERLEFPEIVSFTAAINLRSRRVMEKLGLTTDPSDDFDHPRVHADSPLAHHVLYRLTSEEWIRP